ncbi:hypothetical protein BV20DRAFT_746344 [Pilatotrama ljubarskyi]|nr:hypothetical protein BV20DRAFT_746344 [Pilatotrama ljubarskyi]
MGEWRALLFVSRCEKGYRGFASQASPWLFCHVGGTVALSRTMTPSQNVLLSAHRADHDAMLALLTTVCCTLRRTPKATELLLTDDNAAEPCAKMAASSRIHSRTRAGWRRYVPQRRGFPARLLWLWAPGSLQEYEYSIDRIRGRLAQSKHRSQSLR